MRVWIVSTTAFVVAGLSVSEGFVASPIATSTATTVKHLQLLKSSNQNDDEKEAGVVGETRRSFVSATSFSAMLLAGAGISFWPITSEANDSKALSEEYRQGTAALANMDDQAPVPREAYKKLPSGVIYADLRPGTGGEEIKAGSKVNMQWVLRKSNGYFVDSSDVSGGVPFIFTVGDKGGAIAGVDEGIRGMKVGGVRGLLIPPSLAYVQGLEDDKPGPIPVGFGPKQQMRRVMSVRKDVPGEYIFLEVQPTRIR